MTPGILRMKCDTLCPPGLCHCSPTSVSSHQSFGHTALNHTGIPWLNCTLSRPHAFVPRASWPGMPFSPTCPNGCSPDPAQTPVLWEGVSPGLVIRTQDETLSVPTAPCLCCSWTETQPKVRASRAACPSGRIPEAPCSRLSGSETQLCTGFQRPLLGALLLSHPSPPCEVPPS